MKTETYKGYELQIGEVKLNSNGRSTQTVLIYKNNNPVGGAYADTALEDAISKAKIKVDNLVK